jgi:hypothetical protein
MLHLVTAEDGSEVAKRMVCAETPEEQGCFPSKAYGVRRNSRRTRVLSCRAKAMSVLRCRILFIRLVDTCNVFCCRLM